MQEMTEILDMVKQISKAYGKNRSEKELELREQKMQAEIALKQSQGELHRLKTEIAQGKYIAVEEVMVDPIFVKADDCIFYFSKRRPSQLREMSDMSQTITRIRDTNEFMSAVSMKQRIEACFSLFIKKQLPTQGIGRGGSGATGPRQTYDGKMLTPGMISELNAGDDVVQINHKAKQTMLPPTSSSSSG